MSSKHKVSILFPENIPKIRTKSELDLKRKNELKGIQDDFLQTSKICLLDKETYKTTARVSQGLLPRPKSCTNNQSLSNCQTRSQLSSLRKEQNNTANDNFVDYSFKNSEERLLERERSYWATPSPGLTYESIKKNRIKSDLKHLTETFGIQRIGIHHSPIPKFSENCKEYWKTDEKASDELVFEKNGISKVYFKQKKNDDICINPTKLQFHPGFYSPISKFRRKRDKNVGAVRVHKPIKHEEIKKSKRVVYSFVDILDNTSVSSKKLRSGGFFSSKRLH